MKKMIFWLGIASGIVLLYRGVKQFLGGLFLGIRPVTEKDRAADEALAKQIRQESLARGDEPWMAEFYYADTVDLSEQAQRVGWMAALFGLLQLLVGMMLLYGWWKLLDCVM